MKKYSRHRSLKELRAECKRRGWKINDDRYQNFGSDFVTIIFRCGRVTGQVLFSTVNGGFFGKTRSGVEVNSDVTTHEQTPFFRALLSCCYVEEGA